MRLVFVSFLCFLFTPTVFRQPSSLTVNDLRDPAILRVLFNAKIINRNVGLWQPNTSESQNFNVSYDSMCHTIIDTVMQYRIGGNNFGLVLFTTYAYQDMLQ